MTGHRLPGPDPSVEMWRDAERSTGARLREALEANHQLALDHAKCVLEVERLRAELHRAHEAGGQVVWELADTNAAYEALAAELRDARSYMADLQRNEEIRAQVIRERNAERAALRRGRDEATDRALELAAELAKAREEIERLTARIARQPGNYHLTAKGLAAVQPTDTQENT